MNMASHGAAFAPDDRTALDVDPTEFAFMLAGHIADGLDHPELWPQMADFVGAVPGLVDALFVAHATTLTAREQAHIVVLIALARAGEGRLADARAALNTLTTQHSQSPLVQGATFYVNSLFDPANPKYRLEGRICTAPFTQMDVLDGSTHLCCASWLGTSIGDLAQGDWRDTWNSPNAQAIRESIHDGSYRYCNKITCPRINDGSLDDPEELKRDHPEFVAILDDQQTVMARGPDTVNLAYDQTCNLSCPSCRVGKIASDRATRERFDELQTRSIKPVLRDAKLVVVTGSGDPFASKNFRTLMQEIGPDDYPDLKVRVMTNGMLLNPREWARFPHLHGRTEKLRVSLDAATGPTHERLRRGARWDVMLENLEFFGRLAREHQVESFELTFVVQRDNYREMGDFVDLAHRVGADVAFFASITNWGTFSDADFAEASVGNPTHPEHAAFLAAMRDPRLRDPMVVLGDLTAFLHTDRANAA